MTKMNRIWTSLLTASLMSLTIHAHAATLLVGSYTDGGSEGIYRYGFDEKTGHIDPSPQQVVESVSPSWLVLSADQRQLFAVNETPNGNVSSFVVSAKGEIKALNQVTSQGDEPTHASLSQDQRYLFVANYAVKPDPGGSLVVVPVAKDGKLKPVVQQARHKASGSTPSARPAPMCIRWCCHRTAATCMPATWVPTRCSSTVTTVPAQTTR